MPAAKACHSVFAHQQQFISPQREASMRKSRSGSLYDDRMRRFQRQRTASSPRAGFQRNASSSGANRSGIIQISAQRILCSGAFDCQQLCSEIACCRSMHNRHMPGSLPRSSMTSCHSLSAISPAQLRTRNDHASRQPAFSSPFLYLYKCKAAIITLFV